MEETSGACLARIHQSRRDASNNVSMELLGEPKLVFAPLRKKAAD